MGRVSLFNSFSRLLHMLLVFTSRCSYSFCSSISKPPLSSSENTNTNQSKLLPKPMGPSRMQPKQRQQRRLLPINRNMDLSFLSSLTGCPRFHRWSLVCHLLPSKPSTPFILTPNFPFYLTLPYCIPSTLPTDHLANLALAAS